LFLKTRNKIINEAEGTIEYSFDYSSDPLSNGAFTVQRDLQFSRSDDGSSTISERGSVRNSNGATSPLKLTAAVNYFNSNISGGINGRIFDTYYSQASGCGCSGAAASGDLRRAGIEHSYSDYNGLFGYSYVFRDQCTSLTNGAFFVSNEKNTTKSVHNFFLGITPYDGEIAQRQNTSSLTSEKQTISVLCNTTGKIIDDYLAAAKTKISVPDSNTYFMESAEYSFEPDNSKFVLSLGYNYTGNKVYSDYNV
jgi:hypothetical protein